jgi:HSP90 family molecular chaperone
MKAFEEETNFSLIDQFHVGFFIIFVADRVAIASKHDDN